jgi:hypothetical protein
MPGDFEEEKNEAGLRLLDVVDENTAILENAGKDSPKNTASRAFSITTVRTNNLTIKQACSCRPTYSSGRRLCLLSTVRLRQSHSWFENPMFIFP